MYVSVSRCGVETKERRAALMLSLDCHNGSNNPREGRERGRKNIINISPLKWAWEEIGVCYWGPFFWMWKPTQWFLLLDLIRRLARRLVVVILSLFEYFSLLIFNKKLMQSLWVREMWIKSGVVPLAWGWTFSQQPHEKSVLFPFSSAKALPSCWEWNYSWLYCTLQGHEQLEIGDQTNVSHENMSVRTLWFDSSGSLSNSNPNCLHCFTIQFACKLTKLGSSSA